ncbi:hypothetical protein MTO96_043310 [Rhipicephalus appendiculatus]
MKLAYATLNVTLVEVCNNGETDSLLLDRSVDFVFDISKRVPMRSYYGYVKFPPSSLCFPFSASDSAATIVWFVVAVLLRQQQRLMLALEESGLRLRDIRMLYRPCSNGTALAVFDIPFIDYVTVYLVGCSLSLLAFAAEVAYQRYFLARRLQASPPGIP